MDTGASHSILVIRSDLVNKEVRPLAGKVTCEIVIGKAAVLHNFIVAGIINEVIIGVDFLANQGIKIDMENRIMTYTNMEVQLVFVYDNKYKVRRVITKES